MTPKQIKLKQKKIADIRSVLLAEKRKYGIYDDSRGLRYLPVTYYIELQDYVGGLKYLKWFDKNFPDDGGMPDFLFESLIILFYSKLEPEARKKAITTFDSNTYLIDRFLGKSVIPIDKWEWSDLASAEFANLLRYSADDPNLKDFSSWLSDLQQSDTFLQASRRIVELHQRLNVEKIFAKRISLMAEIDLILQTFK